MTAAQEHMSNRLLSLVIMMFATIAVAYIRWFLSLSDTMQSDLRDLHAIGLAVPAAILAFCFQLRMSRIQRLDAWAKEYQALIVDVMDNLVANEKDFFIKDRRVIPLHLTRARMLSGAVAAILKREPTEMPLVAELIRAGKDDTSSESLPLSCNKIIEIAFDSPQFVSNLYR